MSSHRGSIKIKKPRSFIKVLKNNTKASKVTNKGHCCSWLFSALVVLIYFAFILMVAFYPETLGKTLNNKVTSIGIYIDFSIFIITVFIVSIYTLKTNRGSLGNSEAEDLDKNDNNIG